MQPLDERRILVIDDNELIHGDFRKMLVPSENRDLQEELAAAEAAIFDEVPAMPAVRKHLFTVDSAFQGEQGIAMIKQAAAEGRPYQLAFVDMRMPPGLDGVQTIERIWLADADIQVVICTAFSDYSWEQIASRLGDSDRLLILKKPFDDIEVCQLAAALSEKWCVTRQARLKLHEMEALVERRTAELKHAAFTDRLTGLPNRQNLLDRLRLSIDANRVNSRHEYAVLFLDFDRFKVVNDSLGHECGDHMLTEVARRLSRTLSDVTATDSGFSMAARLGGDEFVVLIESPAADATAVALAERLLQVMAEPYELSGTTVQSSVSIGVTTSRFGYTSAEAIVRDADTAMYRAKAAGKARYAMFDQSMHEQAVQRLTLEADLRRATAADGQIRAYCQPIVSIHSNEIVGFEVLARWQHPTRGLVLPGQFIPLAEEINLIGDIGATVLRLAAEQLAAWRDRPYFDSLFLSVNVSPRQLSAVASAELLELLKALIQRHKFNPANLKLEITESVIIEDFHHAQKVFQKIRQLGITLHLDDFGTGYSSLSCLHQFPISGLKIDRSFVNHVSDRDAYLTVVSAIVSLAHGLGIELTAEGVETPAQLAMLQSIGCDLAQGYLFSKPRPLAEAETLIDTASAVAA